MPTPNIQSLFLFIFLLFLNQCYSNKLENIKRKIQRIISDSCFQLKSCFNGDARAPSIPLLNFPFKRHYCNLYVARKNLFIDVTHNSSFLCFKNILVFSTFLTKWRWQLKNFSIWICVPLMMNSLAFSPNSCDYTHIWIEFELCKWKELRQVLIPHPFLPFIVSLLVNNEEINTFPSLHIFHVNATISTSYCCLVFLNLSTIQALFQMSTIKCVGKFLQLFLSTSLLILSLYPSPPIGLGQLPLPNSKI